LPVNGTNFDFRVPTAIGARIDAADDEQLKVGAGYDHTWVINNPEAGSLATAAVASSAKTGIVLEVKTTLPGVQLYSGNWLSGLPGKIPGTVNARRFAFCLEPQFFPDSPNRGYFPSPVLRPRDQYHHIVIFKASVPK
jgi:aldose 1-epimerase